MKSIRLNRGFAALLSISVILTAVAGISADAAADSLKITGIEESVVHGSRIPWILVSHAHTGITIRVQAGSSVRSCRYREYDSSGNLVREFGSAWEDDRCWRGPTRNGVTSGNVPRSTNTWRMEYEEPRIRREPIADTLPPEHLACLERQLDAFAPYFNRFSVSRRAALRQSSFQMIMTDNLRNSVSGDEFSADGMATGSLSVERRGTGTSDRVFTFTVGINAPESGETWDSSSPNACNTASPSQFRRRFTRLGETIASTEPIIQWEEILRRTQGYPDTSFVDDEGREMYASLLSAEPGRITPRAVFDEGLVNEHQPNFLPGPSVPVIEADVGV